MSETKQPTLGHAYLFTGTKTVNETFITTRGSTPTENDNRNPATKVFCADTREVIEKGLKKVKYS